MCKMGLFRRIFTNDIIMLVLVLINTGIIFISGFMPDQGESLLIVDSIFTLLFLFEAIVKIQVNGFSQYWAEGWNRFDFILVLLALPSCMNVFGVVFPTTSILLSLRTMRAFKSFRLLQFIPNIDSLLNGIKLAFKASFIVTIGLIVFLLCSVSLRHSCSAVQRLSILEILLSVCILFSACSPSRGGMKCLKQLQRIAVRLWLYLHESIFQYSYSWVALSE